MAKEKKDIFIGITIFLLLFLVLAIMKIGIDNQYKFRQTVNKACHPYVLVDTTVNRDFVVCESPEGPVLKTLPK